VSTAAKTSGLLLDELDGIVCGLIGAYEQLFATAIERREAMGRADTAGLARCMERDAGVVQEIARLEAQRERVVGGLARSMGSQDGSRTTMTWIAERAPEGRREGMLARAGELRELIQKTRTLGEHTRAAAEILASHMQGMMKQVHAKLNHAKTYGRLGAVESGRSIVSALDLTT
jgi:hypothetical protein